MEAGEAHISYTEGSTYRHSFAAGHNEKEGGGRNRKSNGAGIIECYVESENLLEAKVCELYKGSVKFLRLVL